MPTAIARILYLHGFASSPDSRKARFFGDKLAAEGLTMDALDLAQGDFAHLTLTGQLNVVEQAANKEPVILIGSSMGGYLAALYAARHPEVERLILMAPAFCFHSLWQEELGPARMAEWRKKGSVPVFHYGANGQMDLSYELIEDAQKYEDYPDISVPCLVFHGLHDLVVPAALSEEFAFGRSHVQLKKLKSGHELTDSLDEIWNDSKPFLLDRTYENARAIEET